MCSDSNSRGMTIYLRIGRTVSSHDTLSGGERKHAISKEEINKTETKFKQIHSNDGMLKIYTEVFNY